MSKAVDDPSLSRLEWNEKLSKLLATLPHKGGAIDLDQQARRTLRHLLDPSLNRLERVVEPFPSDPLLCPNCGTSATSVTSPYCSPLCREEGAFVRQFRAGLESGVVFEDERQANFGQNLWHLLGAGYPRRVALIPPKALAKITARGCEVCGAEAVTVDHTSSG